MIVNFIPIVFQHNDKNVRVEGTALVLEITRWIGPSINTFLDGLKPVQIKELQEQIAKIQPGLAQPLRWRRCEQPKEVATTSMDSVLEEKMQAGKEDSLGSMSAIIDAYSLCEPVNVLDRIPEGFYEGLESSKWKDRKDALDALHAVIKVPKIEDGQFGTLINVLVKVEISFLAINLSI